jgi:hypothetical protein
LCNPAQHRREVLAVDARSKSIKDFADHHGIGMTTARKEIKAGRLKALKVRRRVIITDEAERDWLQSLPAAFSSDGQRAA